MKKLLIRRLNFIIIINKKNIKKRESLSFKLYIIWFTLIVTVALSVAP